jgi:5-methylcytosine-specific restriction endonuclease McrA
MSVYVISKDGQPLMPTERFGKVRRLLRDKKAKVIRRCPFTVKLLYEPETKAVQEVVLGQDTGSKCAGTACIANDKVLYQSEVILRDDIKKKMDNRRGARRNRRNRKTRYRKARFLNRANSTRKDRLPPSVSSKVQSHVDEIEFCKKILPISKIVLEVSQFDTQLMKNPVLINEKVRHWGYQKGFNYEYSSRREAVLNRDNYTCQCCGKKRVRLEVHHIIFRSKGGTDDENNLITVCKGCHDAIHNGTLVLTKTPRRLNLKHATHMSIIRGQLLKIYPDAIETFGFVTKENRNNLNLQKEHFIDACVIASGGKEFKQLDLLFKKRRVPRQNRQLCKGIRGEKKIPTGKILGFRRYDKIKYLNEICFVKGRRSRGVFVLMDIDNKTIDFRDRGGRLNVSYKLLERLNTRRSVLCIGQISLNCDKGVKRC